MKVYIKRGNTNYKEKRLVDKLQSVIDKKIAENPEFANEFKPAESFEQLKSLHDQYCIEEATVVSETTTNTDTSADSTADSHTEFRNSAAETIEKPANEIIDPFNRANPIVREYVLKEEFTDDSLNKEPINQNFNEPTSFGQAFKLPEDGAPQEQGGKTSSNSGTGNQGGKKPPPQQPFNPSFGDMENAKKKKSTKRFAKYIVEAVCMLSEYGYVYYSTKDINEIKLAEYELNNTIELDVLLTLEDNQQITVKEFFKRQCIFAEKNAKIPADEKDDLADALAEVLLEKGIAPTPTQELMMIAGKIFGGKLLQCMGQKSQIDSILAQLKINKQEVSEDVEDEMRKAEDAAVERDRQTQETAKAEVVEVEPVNSVVEEVTMNFGTPIHEVE